MRKMLMVLMMVFGFGAAAFAGTYKTYSFSIVKLENIYTFGGYAFMENKPNTYEIFENETWFNASKDIVKKFVTVVPNFNGAVTYSTLVNGTDPVTLVFEYKNGKHIKTVVYRFYYDPEKDANR